MRIPIVHRLPAASLAAACALLALACAQPKSTRGTGNLAGTITYREHIALPSSARVEIQLVDATDPNETSPVIAERLIDHPGQVPIAFSLAYDPASVKTSRTYSLRVRIRVGEDVWFASPFDLRVLTGGNPDRLDVQLNRVSAGGAVTSSVPPPELDPDPPNLDPRVKSARDAARTIDAGLDRLDMREVTDGPEQSGFEPRRLRLWIRGEQPVKLTVIEAFQDGRKAASASYYFHDGQLFWVRATDGGYLFEGDALSVWLDGRLQPVANADPAATRSNQTRVQADLRSALASFGLE